MAKMKNENSLLFLYEGETEAEFYKIIFDHYNYTKENTKKLQQFKWCI
jgi:hypothetical protein